MPSECGNPTSSSTWRRVAFAERAHRRDEVAEAVHREAGRLARRASRRRRRPGGRDGARRRGLRPAKRPSERLARRPPMSPSRRMFARRERIAPRAGRRPATKRSLLSRRARGSRETATCSTPASVDDPISSTAAMERSGKPAQCFVRFRRSSSMAPIEGAFPQQDRGGIGVIGVDAEDVRHRGSARAPARVARAARIHDVPPTSTNPSRQCRRQAPFQRSTVPGGCSVVHA